MSSIFVVQFDLFVVLELSCKLEMSIYRNQLKILTTKKTRKKILVQFDALAVIDCINSMSTLAALEFIASDIKTLLASFKIGSVMFLNRQFIGDSHNLVGLGKLCGALG